MPTSYKFFKNEVKEWFKNNVPANTRILDVGAGEGTYGKLLAHLEYDIDALEIWAPYVNEFELWNYYNVVYDGDIRTFDYSNYDFLILGDILEHLTAEEGQKLIQDVKNTGKQCLVAIPYMMEQGTYEGNTYETHLQPDLTTDVMSERYPTLELLYGNMWYGYYIERKMIDKAFVLYATEAYYDIITACVNSLVTFSKHPVFVYMLNSDAKIYKATTIRWDCNIKEIEYNTKDQFYINRTDDRIYNILIERPMIVKDCLKYANTVAYVDSDSVATPLVDRIFDFSITHYPLFVDSIYDVMMLDGKANLELPACEFFDAERKSYRQTGYFIANQDCVPFLDEWYWMCTHPTIKKDFKFYAPFHEETIANVLLWKNEHTDCLPYLYTNASLDILNKIDEYEFDKEHWQWFKLPKKENLLFYHGEKRPDVMYKMIDKLKEKKLNIMFLAPHLSTGGMPAFLQKTVEVLQNYVHISVIEYQCHSLDYVVQRNALKELADVYTLYENKMELFDLIYHIQPDIIHIHEPAERFDRGMIQRLYSDNRTYRIVETCHDVSFNPNEKIFHPDAYAFCTPYHLKTFANLPSYKEVIEFPIENNVVSDIIKHKAKVKLGFSLVKTNVLNVGLWTQGKNQGEGLDIARNYPDMNFHFVGNQAGNFKDYWEPLMRNLPPNVTIWGERADTQLFMQATDIFMFNSTWECNPLVLREAIGYGLPIVARNLEQYETMFTNYIQPIDTNLHNIKATYSIPNQLDDYTNAYRNFYNTVMNIPLQEQTVDITQHFVIQPFLEIKGVSGSNFKVCFYEENGSLSTEFNIKINHWVKLDREYYTKWTTKVWQDDKLIYNYTLDYTDKTVFIHFDSESLGDTLAWIPYCLEFKKKHNCKVVVSTFWNKILNYPELEFVEPGSTINTYGQYILGWRYNSNREPTLPNTIPLQQAATNILGLDFQEIRPSVRFDRGNNKYGRYVTIATNSTSGCKFWTREGWQEVINYLHDKGYQVVNISKENNPFDNCVKIDDTSIENTMSVIHHSEFFIGLSSGLSWLAWAVGAQVVMISNFTNKDHEFQSHCIRITDESLCHGCWNNPNFKFDKGDWDWCPINKNTPKHFECHRGIRAEKVIASLQPLIDF